MIRKLILILILMSNLPLYAEVGGEAGEPSSEEMVFKEFERLQALKEQDPEAYHQIIQERKERLKQDLEKLRHERQDRFGAFLQKEKEFRKRKLEYFRVRHPQAFQRFAAQRLRRLDEARQRNPERFQRFMEEHPRVRERYEKYHRRQDRVSGERFMRRKRMDR
ncbi:MAG: hypothetical protein HY447_03500 [Candidatus Omnitrophica bacterium]|nr:hypothetical protein [Candidatus Omnitrophota bacterium]